MAVRKLKVEQQQELPLPGLNPRQPNLYWKSGLFNEVYLEHDLPKVVSDWVNDEAGPFHDFYQGFINLCVEHDKKGHKFEHWNEADTQREWVVRVMELLGWHDKCEHQRDYPFTDNISFTIEEGKSKRSYRPDLLYCDEPSEIPLLKEKKGSGDIKAAIEYCKMIVEVKSWQRLDHMSKDTSKVKSIKTTDKDDSTKGYEPEEQCLKYMGILNQSWGILTDGARWRMLHSELSDGPNKRYFEFNLGHARRSALTLLEDQGGLAWKDFVSNLKYFFYLFRKEAFYPPKKAPQLLNNVLEFSKKYATRIEEDLRSSFIEAMTIICNGYHQSLGRKANTSDLEMIRNVAESHLFNILFIKSCEVRHILPVRDPKYLRHSLTEVIDTLEFPNYNPLASEEFNSKRLEKLFSTFKFSANGTELYERLMKLYSIVQEGDFGLEIVGFKETVFEKGEIEFAKKYKIRNYDIVRLLFALGYVKAPDGEERKFQQIPYSYFTPRQLGSIYESFLEYSLSDAETDMAFIEGKWIAAKHDSEKVGTKTCPKVTKGNLYFDVDDKTRKVTGSYYTPDFIVRYIVDKTVGPIIEGRRSKEILSLKVCDPSMGSGHFLNSVLQYLTDYYRATLADENSSDIDESYTESSQKILHSCIYGVDLNPRAVKLSKMGLWLATAFPGRKLEQLDDQIKCGDSLIEDKKYSPYAFSWKKEFGFTFDAIVGNPPYVFARDKKLGETSKEYFEKTFRWSHYQANTTQLFVEKCTALLGDEGRLGFILPNTWLTIKTSDTFRENVLKNFNNIHIVNCLVKVFENASVDNAILIGSLDKLSEEKKVDTLILTEAGFNCIDTRENVTPSGEVIFIGKEQNSGKILQIEKTASPLGEQFEVRTGLKAYQEGKGKPKQTKQQKETRAFHSSKKQNANYRKYLDGKDVQRFRLGWSGEYLNYGKHLAEPRSVELFQGYRVLVRQIPSKPPYCMNAVVCSGEELNDINSMIVKANSEEDAYLIAGILNSRVVSEWFIRKFDKFQRKTFPQIKVGELSQFPFPINLTSSVRKEIITLSRRLHTCLASKQPIQSKVDELNTALENAVCSAFGIKKTKAA